jgi:hypothetical protein
MPRLLPRSAIRRALPDQGVFPLPARVMGVFSAIVVSEALIVRAGEVQFPESRPVGAQLVGDQQLRCLALFLKKLAHQPECRLRISPTLNEDFEDLALVVNGAHRYIRFPAMRTTISSK